MLRWMVVLILGLSVLASTVAGPWIGPTAADIVAALAAIGLVGLALGRLWNVLT